MKTAKQPFYRFYMLKTHMQISYKLVVQACHDFKILMHNSKGKEINFNCLYSLGLSGKIESNKKIFTTSLIG